MRMGKKMRDRPPAMRYFSRTQFARRKDHVKKNGIVLARRTLAVLLTVWALTDASYLPERLHSFLHSLNHEPASSSAIEWARHDYLIELGFLVTRIVGYSLMARGLFKGGPEIEDLLMPEPEENAAGL
jgi:hypothetical protein